MTKKTRLLLIALPWLSLPLLVAGFRAVWDRLPARLAVHFDSSGAADGFMSRGEFLAVASGLTLFVLAQFTFRLSRLGEREGSAAVFVFYYLGAGLLSAVFLGLLVYNS